MHKLTRDFCLLLLTLAAGGNMYGIDTPPAAPTQPAATALNTNLPGPKIEFSTPIYDFGKAQAGEVIKYSYVFRNTGDQPLEVTAVQPSCGCTTAGDWTRKVMPGESGTVAVQFNSANFNGQVFKTVAVSSNDKAHPSTVLQLKGAVWRPIELIPLYTVMNVPPDVPSTSASVRIINHLEEPMLVYAPESNNRSFGATLVTNQPGKEYQLTIASVNELNPGNVQGKVSLKTSSAKTPTLDVPFWVNVQPVISVIPQRISLPQAPLRAKFPSTITIQNNSTNGLTLSDAEVNVPGVDVLLKEIQPKRVYSVSLSFPEGFELPAGSPVALTVKSSQSRMPEIKVPLTQVARPVVVSPVVPKPPLPAAPGVSKPTASIQSTH